MATWTLQNANATSASWTITGYEDSAQSIPRDQIDMLPDGDLKTMLNTVVVPGSGDPEPIADLYATYGTRLSVTSQCPTFWPPANGALTRGFSSGVLGFEAAPPTPSLPAHSASRPLVSFRASVYEGPPNNATVLLTLSVAYSVSR